MAKKQEDGAPKVTNLPLPISDSPLVIDLPDGQKIVIGKMSAGSVIEVATWRGTGRPDSRTNRLMMGMNSGSAAPSEAATAAPSEVAKQSPAAPTDFKGKAIFIAKTLLSAVQQKVSKIVSQVKNRKPIAAKINSTESSSSSPVSTSSEVDEWLEKVLAKSEKRAALVRQKLEAEESKPLPRKVAQARKPVKKAVKTKKKSAPAKRKK